MGRAMVAGGNPDMQVPAAGIQAGTLSVGSVVKLMENGTAVEYLVVNQGKPSGSSLYDTSCDGTWLLRKDIYENRQWHSSNSNAYANSTIHSYLNSTFLNLFDTAEKAAIKQVKIPYVNGTSGSAVASGANGLSAKIFLLSSDEVGFVFPVVEGAKLSYFESGTETSANNKRIAYRNGSATHWWLRSPDSEFTGYAVSITDRGTIDIVICSESLGVRPALVLPKTALFDEDTMILKGGA